MKKNTHKIKLLLTTGLRQTFLQNEMQNSKSKERRKKLQSPQGRGWKVNEYALLYTIIDVKIRYIQRVNTMR
jgi:hypothetical protein